MRKIKEIVEDIIKESERISRLSTTDIINEFKPHLPTMIGIENGEGFFVSLHIKKLISDFVNSKLSDDTVLGKSYTHDELFSIIQRELGNILRELDLNKSYANNNELVISRFNEAIFGHVKKPIELEYIFGCNLFLEKHAAFSIGLVTFQTRKEWLQNKKT